MKKLLTLILPALVLTAGAPLTADAFGAFALDEAAWAFAFAGGERTQAEADQQALSLCAQEGGRDCVIKYQYTGSRCGAAAVAEEQGLRAWGFGHADSRAEAIINAINFCKRENTSGGTCRKVAVACGDAAPPQADAAPQADSTGAPQADAAEAQAADEGEETPYYGAIQWGSNPRQIGDPYDHRYGISVRKTSLEAARQEAEAKCRQAGAKECYHDWLWDITTLPPAIAMQQNEAFKNWVEHHTGQWGGATNSFRCVALVSDGPKHLIRPLVKWGGSREEAIERSKRACEASGYNCQLNVAACADDDAPQVADAPAPAADAPACDDAEDCIARGNEKYLRQPPRDHDGAIAYYDRAIELAPDLAVAYYIRAEAKSDRTFARAGKDRKLAFLRGNATGDAYHDFRGAIADYDRAIELAPDWAQAYYARAMAKSFIGDREGNKADYDRAIELGL